MLYNEVPHQPLTHLVAILLLPVKPTLTRAHRLCVASPIVWPSCVRPLRAAFLWRNSKHMCVRHQVLAGSTSMGGRGVICCVTYSGLCDVV